MAILKSKVMSTKSKTFFIGFNSDLQVVVFEDFAHFFFYRFYLLGRFAQVASPPSLYNPTLTSRWVSWDKRNSPTSSQVSTPSKLSFFTSKTDLILRHGMLVL